MKRLRYGYKGKNAKIMAATMFPGFPIFVCASKLRPYISIPLEIIIIINENQANPHDECPQ